MSIVPSQTASVSDSGLFESFDFVNEILMVIGFESDEGNICSFTSISIGFKNSIPAIS